MHAHVSVQLKHWRPFLAQKFSTFQAFFSHVATCPMSVSMFFKFEMLVHWMIPTKIADWSPLPKQSMPCLVSFDGAKAPPRKYNMATTFLAHNHAACFENATLLGIFQDFMLYTMMLECYDIFWHTMILLSQPPSFSIIIQK